MFACWKIHDGVTAEMGLQHMFPISDPNITIVQLFCHQRNSKAQVANENHMPINLRGTLMADYLKIKNFLEARLVEILQCLL